MAVTLGMSCTRFLLLDSLGVLVSVPTSIAGQVNVGNATGATLNCWDGAGGPKGDGAINGGTGADTRHGGGRAEPRDRGRGGEAVQDPVVAVWRGARRGDGRGEVAAWVWGIGIRRLIDQLEQYTGYLNNEIHGAFDFGQIVGQSGGFRPIAGMPVVADLLAKARLEALLYAQAAADGGELILPPHKLLTPEQYLKAIGE